MIQSVNGRTNKWWTIIIGIGLALSPVHNKWLTDLATNSDGETLFFLPAFGYLVLIMGCGMFLLYHWGRVKEVGWGDKRIVIPLLVIVGAIGLSGISADGIQAKVAPLGAGVALLAVYLAARVLGKDVFLPLAVGVAVASLGIIGYGLRYPGTVTGGLVFEGNFDIATGFILLGAALFIHRWRWLLACLAVVALLFSGAPEAVFAIGVIGIVAVFRKDWSKRATVVAGVLVVLAVVGLVSGQAQKLYSYVGDSLNLNPVVHYIDSEGEMVNTSTLGIRVQQIEDAMSNIKPLGDGYNLTAFRVSTVHNVPLIIVQQLGWPGIVAGIAWLWVMVFCLIKTRWKYAVALVLVLGIFDHYVWDQLAPWTFAIVGVASINNIESDLIFGRSHATNVDEHSSKR